MELIPNWTEPTEFELDVWDGVTNRAVDFRLREVAYEEDGNYTIAYAGVQRLIDGHWTNHRVTIGVSKRNPIDRPYRLKGRAFSLTRAIKKAIR